MNKKMSIRAYQWLTLLLCVTFVSQTVRGTTMSMIPSKNAFSDSRNVFDRCSNRPILNNYTYQQNNNSSFSTQEHESATTTEDDMREHYTTVDDILDLADESPNPVNNTKVVKDPKIEKSGDAPSSEQQNGDIDDLLSTLYDDGYGLPEIVNDNNKKPTQQKNGNNNDASNNNAKVVEVPKIEKNGDATSSEQQKRDKNNKENKEIKKLQPGKTIEEQNKEPKNIHLCSNENEQDHDDGSNELNHQNTISEEDDDAATSEAAKILLTADELQKRLDDLKRFNSSKDNENSNGDSYEQLKKKVDQLEKKANTQDYTYVIGYILIILWLYQKFFVKAN